MRIDEAADTEVEMLAVLRIGCACGAPAIYAPCWSPTDRKSSAKDWIWESRGLLTLGMHTRSPAAVVAMKAWRARTALRQKLMYSANECFRVDAIKCS